MPRFATIALVLVSVTGGFTSIQKASGPIRVDVRAVADDRGPFPALGASLFWAAWAYKHDRPRLDAHLKLLSAHNFDYIRALGVVGRQPYWAGREIDSRWPDYDQVIAGLTDHVFDTYGLRIEWTIFGDADQMVADAADRTGLVDRFAAMSRGREHKIMHFELANESWQNGFAGPAGIEQLRALARQLDERTTIPVAVSDSEGHTCADHLSLYGGLNMQIMTDHFPRDVSGGAGRWAPVLAPWDIRACEGLPSVISSNEPIGPRSSVVSESDPTRIVGAAVSSWMAGVGLYVFHTDAGVWGREPLSSMPAADAILAGLSQARRYVPADIANWQRSRRDSPAHPFRSEGGVEVLATVKDDRFFVAGVGVDGELQLTARRDVDFQQIDPLTGARQPSSRLAAGGSTALKAGAGLILLEGRFTGPAK